MTKQVLIARISDVHLPPTDAKSALERLMEINSSKYKSAHKLTIDHVKVYHPGSDKEAKLYFSDNQTGVHIPRSTPGLIRLFEDGVEVLIKVAQQGMLVANLVYQLRGSTNGPNMMLIYTWNVADGGMYTNEFHGDTQEVQWE